MKRFSFDILVSLFALLLLLGGQPAAGQHQVVVEPEESELLIEGTSTVNSFTCEAEEIEGRARLDSSGQAQRTEATAEVVVPVRQFDCGKQRMNWDLYDALKASAHPFIRFELDTAEVVEQEPKAYQLRTSGWLTIAGTEQPVTLEVDAQHLPDGRYRAQGSQPLSMRAFGIDPPSALLGLVKAHDRIVVHFDLIARPMTPTSSE